MTMICRCSEEGRAEADAALARCKEALGVTDDANFLSALIMELEWEYRAHVSMIAADQWFGVSVDQDGEVITAECDRVEDGLVACWEHFAKPAG